MLYHYTKGRGRDRNSRGKDAHLLLQGPTLRAYVDVQLTASS